MALHKHARDVTSPIATYPAKTLAQILWAVFQSSLYFCLFVVLHFNFPAMRIHPSSDEVVVVGVQLAGAPFLVRESVSKVFRVEDCTAVGNGPTGKARQATIYMQAGRAIKVASFEISRPEEAPNAHALLPLQSLRGADPTDQRVFKRCQYPRDDSGRPDDIVVDEYGDLRLHFGNGPAHLPPLVGLANAEHADLFGVDSIGYLSQGLGVRVDGDENDLVRLGFHTGPECLCKLLATSGDGRADDGDILGIICWIFGYWGWAERPMGNAVYDQANIPKQPGRKVRSTNNVRLSSTPRLSRSQSRVVESTHHAKTATQSQEFMLLP